MDAGQKGETVLLHVPLESQTFPHLFSCPFLRQCSSRGFCPLCCPRSVHPTQPWHRHLSCSCLRAELCSDVFGLTDTFVAEGTARVHSQGSCFISQCSTGLSSSSTSFHLLLVLTLIRNPSRPSLELGFCAGVFTPDVSPRQSPAVAIVLM